MLFSLARTKLPSYVTPAIRRWRCSWATTSIAGVARAAAVAGRWLPAAFGCLALAGIGIAIAVPLAAKQFLPGDEWLGLIGLTPLVGGLACIGLAFVRNYRTAAAVFGASAVAFATLLFAVGADRADRHQANHLLFHAIYRQSAQPQIASYQILEPSWVFYGGRPIREIPAPPVQKDAYHLAAEQAAGFLNSSEDAFVITSENKLPELCRYCQPTWRCSKLCRIS